MRVILQIASGPQLGRKAMLGVHRELSIGRSEWAELACPDDAKMSRVHCKLETNAFGCSVEDLGSSNGTFVNETQITEKTVLREGDTLRAGSTQFSIQIEGDSLREAETINHEERAAERALTESRNSALELATRQAILQGEQKLGYLLAKGASGLSLFTPSKPPGKQATVEAARLALLLKEVSPQFLLVYPLKAPEFKADDFPDAQPIFDWLPSEVQMERSPLLLSSDAVDDLPALFEKAWERTLVVMNAPLTPDETLTMLRQAIRPAGTEGLLGICWPNVLDGLLCGGDGSLFEGPLADVQAVLLEDAANDLAWKLIADECFIDVLDGIGLQQVQPAHH